MTTPVEPLPDLIEESLEEAQFLWTRWEAELSSDSRNLHEVWIWTEDRLGGALAGVQLAPPATLERLVAAAIENGGAAAATVCGHVLASAAADNARQLLAAALQAASGPTLAALIRGVEVASLDGSFAPVARLLAGLGPEHAAALARLKAFRRAPPAEELTVAFESKVVALQAAALHAARELPPQYVAAWIEAGLNHEHAAVRLAAMLSGVRRRIPNAWRAVLLAAREPSAEAVPLLPLVAMLGGADEHRVLFAPHGDPRVQRAQLWSLGHVGSREAAERCLAAMRRPELARHAGEAYCTITGADLVRDRLTAEDAAADAPPPAFEADDLDADLVPPPHMLWPLPDPDAVGRHWAAHAARFRPGVRHLRGRPVDTAVLIAAVEQGPMLRRPDHLEELYVRTEGRYDVEARAAGPQQRRMMLAGRARLAESAAA